MPMLLTKLLGLMGTVAANMLLSLATETFMKKLAYKSLKKLAERLPGQLDDELVRDMGIEWGLEKPAEEMK